MATITSRVGLLRIFQSLLYKWLFVHFVCMPAPGRLLYDRRISAGVPAERRTIGQSKGADESMQFQCPDRQSVAKAGLASSQGPLKRAGMPRDAERAPA